MFSHFPCGMSAAEKLARWLTVGLLFGVWMSSARGQVPVPRRSFPHALYYDAFAFYHRGEYIEAKTLFQRAARGGVATSRGRWIDSICYFTMLGECALRLGQRGEALQQYEAALQLALVHEGWTARIRWPERLEVSQRTVPRPPNWGRSARNRPQARLPRLMQMQQGDVDTATAIRSGGLLQNRYTMLVDATEILRCTALAMRRRRQILGPLCRHDRLSQRLADSMARMPVPPNHWLAVWRHLLVGIARSATGEPDRAVAALKQSLSIGNTLDHPMTSMALLELADLALDADEFGQAASFYFEATFPAAVQTLYDDVAEGMRGVVLARRLSRQDAPQAMLASAIDWARRESRALHVRLLLLSSQCQLAAGQAAAAGLTLQLAEQALKRTDMGRGPEGVLLAYLLAHASIQQGNLAAGVARLPGILKRQQAVSPWLFQVGLAHRLLQRRAVTPRVAAEICRDVLREPTGNDWITDPLDTLAYETASIIQPLLAWFDLSMRRKEHERAVQVYQRIQRARWNRWLFLGGRRLDLRHMWLADPEVLSKEVQALRREFFLADPSLQKQVAALQASTVRLRQLSAKAQEDDEQLQKELRNAATVQTTLSAEMESRLWDAALRPVASRPAFAPVATLEELQAALQPGEMILAFFHTPTAMYVIALHKQSYTLVPAGKPAAWHAAVRQWLRAARVHDGHKSLPFEPSTLEAWKKAAEPIAAQLKRVLPSQLRPKDVRMVTVIPDGPLWYFPLEALPDEEGRFWIEKTAVRYLPLLGCVAKPSRPIPRSPVTAVLERRFWAGDGEAAEEERRAQALARLEQSIPRLVRRHPSDRPELPVFVSMTTWDQLLILTDGWPPARSLEKWSLLGGPREKGTRESVAAWLGAPLRVPYRVVLPGFHSGAEGLAESRADGTDLFVTSCALLAGGASSVAISRWRIPADSALQLVREYVAETDELAGPRAWQRSVQLFWEATVDPEVSARLRVDPDVDAIPGKHPFFWGSLLVIESWPGDRDAKP